MSALGQKQTFRSAIAMSALRPKADICSALAHVRFVPKADIAGTMRVMFAPSWSRARSAGGARLACAERQNDMKCRATWISR